MRRRSYSYPSCSVCPAWWSLLAPEGVCPLAWHTLGVGICSAGWLPGRVQIYFCLLRRIFWVGSSSAGMSSYTYKGVQEWNRSCQGTTRKVRSLSVLMSPAHKQTHHLHCLCTRKLISMCIKHKVAGRDVQIVCCPPPSKVVLLCAYHSLLSRYIQCIVFKCK